MLADATIVSVVPEKVPVAPLGSPDTDRLTEPVKPLTGVTVIPSLPLTPCASVKVPEAADSVNPGVDADATTKVTVTVCLRPFEEPEPLVVPLIRIG